MGKRKEKGKSPHLVLDYLSFPGFNRVFFPHLLLLCLSLFQFQSLPALALSVPLISLATATCTCSCSLVKPILQATMSVCPSSYRSVNNSFFSQTTPACTYHCCLFSIASTQRLNRCQHAWHLLALDELFSNSINSHLTATPTYACYYCTFSNSSLSPLDLTLLTPAFDVSVCRWSPLSDQASPLPPRLGCDDIKGLLF